MIGFKQVLEDLNLFMEETHVRKYCSEICRGYCCSDSTCFGKTSKDFNWCHQHPTCTSFMCLELQHIVLFESEIRQCIRTDMYTFKTEVYKNMYLLFENDGQKWKNIFFLPYSIINLEFKHPFPTFKEVEIKSIRKVMDKLIKNKSQIR